MQAQAGRPSWNCSLAISQDEMARVERSIEVSVVFLISRRSVYQDELCLLGNEIGVQVVKGADLVNRCVVDTDEPKRGTCRKSVFAETEKCIELRSINVGAAGFRISLHELERVTQL